MDEEEVIVILECFNPTCVQPAAETQADRARLEAEGRNDVGRREWSAHTDPEGNSLNGSLNCPNCGAPGRTWSL